MPKSLRKRENFRSAFAGIVRHRGKIEAVLHNARQAHALRDETGSLAAFFWQFEPNDADRPKRLDERSLSAQSQTPASRAMSRALKQRGFRFVEPTTAYAFMQSIDHAGSCDGRTVAGIRSRSKALRGPAVGEARSSRPLLPLRRARPCRRLPDLPGSPRQSEAPSSHRPLSPSPASRAFAQTSLPSRSPASA
ncbi:MAG: hypothetical protein CL908_01710 [Deltaproteobacteria bacterium]|nr:hypothetical protein [Deltaproteobacteria bacterium]